MIAINHSSTFEDILEKPEEKIVFLGKLTLGSSFMEFVNWLKTNQSIVNFTESAFVINKAYITDDEFRTLVKKMCETVGRSLSFYFNDLENQWILNYKPYFDDILPLIEATNN